jgi:single-strand DNA-binding protein
MSAIEAAFFGALGRDCESKTSKAGKPYLRLNVRVGDDRDDAQWISVLAFDPRAIEQADKFLKGARVYVEGKLSSDEWTAQDGTKRHGLSVMSWHCRLAEIGRNKSKRAATSGDKEQPAPKAAAGRAGNDFYDDEIPF